MIFEQFQNSENDVIDVTESTRLRLFRVMQSSGPIDGDISFLLVQLRSAGDRSARGQLTEFVQTVENWAITAHVKSAQLMIKVFHVFRTDRLEKMDVLVAVELRQVLRT